MAGFQNIKQMCILISQLNAVHYAQQLGWEFTENADSEKNPIQEREIEIEIIAGKRGLSAAHGPVKSGAEKDGKWIDFIALTQVFLKDASKLKSILNEISKCFRIELEGKNELKILGHYDKETPDLIDSVNYFISADNVYALNVTEQKIMKIKGRQTGGAGKSEGLSTLELNVEIPPEFDTIIHELTHLKWPDDISHEEKLVNQVGEKVANEIRNAGYIGFPNDSEIQNERLEVLKAFELLDSDFEKFL